MGTEGGSGAVGPCDEKPRAETAPAPPVGREQSGPGEPHPGHPDPGPPDPEHPDPGRIATQPDFGRELTRARQRAGLTVREVARAVGIPASTAGDYFAGRHLPPPSQPGLLPRILRVCGETDPDRLSEWMSTLNRIRRGPGRRPAAATAPYRGLASFQPEDAPWFFGREDLTARLVGLASAVPAPGVPLTVVGPSGSGKSSLLRAGLIPSMPDWPRRVLALFTPGAMPLRELARQLALLGPGRDPAEPDPADPAILAGTSRIEAVLRSDPGEVPGLVPGITPGGSDPRLLIVVDQLEEIFTACRDEAEQQRFITAICALSGPAVVVAALRADFYDRALRYPELARALQERQVVVVPMTRQEVRSAIVEPATLARLAVEDGLVELLLRDLAPHVAEGGPAGPATRPGPCRCCPMRCSPPGRTAMAAGSRSPITRPAGASGTRSRGRPTRSTRRSERTSGTSPGSCSCGWSTWPTTRPRRAGRYRWPSCVTGRARPPHPARCSAGSSRNG